MAKNRVLKKQLRQLREEKAQLEASMDSYDSPSGGWANPFNKFGLETDPTFQTLWLPPLEFNYDQLTQLYQNPLVRKVIRLHKNDGTRNGLTVTHKDNNDLAEEIQSTMEDRFKWIPLMAKMIGIRHLYGGGVLFVDADDGKDPKDPLNINRVKRVNSFQPVERFLAHPFTARPMLGEEKPGQPLHYTITLNGFLGSTTFTCHESRLIRFPLYESDEVLGQRERSRRVSWDVSTVQVIYDTIKRYGIGMQSSSQLLQRFVMDVFKVADMRKFTDLEKLRTYIREQMALRNSMQAVVLPEDGDLSQMVTPTTGMMDITKDIRMDVSMATDIPLSILFSNESGALGGTTTSEDRKTWYDTVKANQTNQYTQMAMEMIEFASLEYGWDIDGIGVQWNSLWSLDPKEQAEVEELYSRADASNVNNLGADSIEIQEARWGLGEFSQRTPDFDKDQALKDQQEMENLEFEEAEKDREMQMKMLEQQNNEKQEPPPQQTSEDDKTFILKIDG